MTSKLTKFVKSTTKKVVDVTKKATKKATEFVDKVVHGRRDFSPNMKTILSKFGEMPIVAITIGRRPLSQVTVTAIDAVSLFQFKKNLEDSPYDKLYHLFLQITVESGIVLILEKRDVITMVVSPKPNPNDEFVPVSHVPQGLTINEMLKNCHNKMGDDFYTYTAYNNNCQDFCLALLVSNFMNDPIYVDFVKQDTVSIFENTGMLSSVANGLTDLSGRLDVIAQGGCNLTSEDAGGNMHHDVKVGFLHHRNLFDFNNNTKDIFNMMSVAGKYQIIGSSNISNLIYNSDYDLQEYDDMKSCDKAYHIFKTKFKSAKNNPNIFITDFKCGEINNKPLRWSYENIVLGENQGITFKSAMMQKKTIKLDVVCIVGGRFLEFSDNYYFKIDKKMLYEKPSKNSIENNLIKSGSDEYAEGNYMKFLKRKFSVAVMNNNVALQEKLVQYFNSEIGYWNKQLSDLKIVQLVLEQNFREPSMITVISNLQIIKQNLSVHISALTQKNIISLSKNIDKICKLKNKNKMSKAMGTLIDKLSTSINNNALQYIKSNNIV